MNNNMHEASIIIEAFGRDRFIARHYERIKLTKLLAGAWVATIEDVTRAVRDRFPSLCQQERVEFEVVCSRTSQKWVLTSDSVKQLT